MRRVRWVVVGLDIVHVPLDFMGLCGSCQVLSARGFKPEPLLAQHTNVYSESCSG